MALMFAICNPQPNWIPRKPKLMFQICQNVRGGLSINNSYRRLFLAIVKLDHGSQSLAQIASQRPGTTTPLPVAADGAGEIHASRAAEAEHILERNDGNVGD